MHEALDFGKSLVSLLFRFRKESETSPHPTTFEIAHSLTRMRECLLHDEGITEAEEKLASQFLYDFPNTDIEGKKQLTAELYQKVSRMHGRSDADIFKEAGEICLAIDHVYGEKKVDYDTTFHGTTIDFFKMELSKKLVSLTNINFPVYTNNF